jgi:hypothetical protein
MIHSSTRARALVLALGTLGVACGDTTANSPAGVDASSDVDATTARDSGVTKPADSGVAKPVDSAVTKPACVPGQSVACVGPGGCATNQVCNAAGSGFGACVCSSSDAGGSACVPGKALACVGPGGCATNQVCTADGTGFGPCTCASTPDASTPACIPGAAIACAGAGGCISSQVCNAAGTGYGGCDCASDGGRTLLCVPGQSVACGGPYACPSYQLCNDAGSAYGSCDCPDAASFLNDAGEVPDGYAPLPPPVGDQGYNAIWASAMDINTGGASNVIYLPFFSAPDCSVIPPFGEAYIVAIVPGTAGPSGTFAACNTPPGTSPCYEPEVFYVPSTQNFEVVKGGSYTLSPFNADGIATGQMSTNEGIVPLVVKNCL